VRSGSAGVLLNICLAPERKDFGCFLLEKSALLYIEVKHLHTDTARSFHIKNMVYSKIHFSSKPGFLELVPARL